MSDEQKSDGDGGEGNQTEAASVEVKQTIEHEQLEEAQKRIALLEKQIEETEVKAQGHLDVALRLKAESENLRKRAEREMVTARQYALERFAKALLEPIDNLERALATEGDGEAFKTIHEGVGMTLKMLQDTLSQFDILHIDPEGEAFDPHHHEAMSMVAHPEAEDNTVISVMQKGYRLNDRLLRPARVVVAKSADTAKKSDESA